MTDDYIPCITNSVSGIRACKVLDEHLSSCPSLLDPTADEHRDCAGCLPRPAEHGMLCSSCWLRVIDATSNLVDQVTHMRSLETGGGQTDNAGVRGSVIGYWPLASGPVLADMLLVDLVLAVLAYCGDTGRDIPRLLARGTVQGFKPAATVEQVRDEVEQLIEFLYGNEAEVVARSAGAEYAVKLARSYQQKQQAYPLHESEHRVPFIRCRACQRVRLTWRPPSYFHDEVVVTCEHCGHRETQAMLEFDLRLIAQQRKVTL